ncbi:putative pentatricopeptide repeat-containing protein At3g49142 [Aristolochia californica]|uniref:putative pentatricopeptide repeat-containing protein At3g49142 n=1 Tax=Aristolochia californica TaxID=171875 RepID=UPI0035E36626
MFREVAYMSSLLRQCVPLCAIKPGRQIHAQIIVHRLLPHTTLGTDILLLYCRCGDLKTARQVFDGMPGRNMHSWNILISSFVNHSAYKEAYCLFNAFLDAGLCPDGYTFPALFKGSGGMVSITQGKMFHVLAIRLGFEDHVVVASSILDMYAKCGSLNEASQLFSNMSRRDVVVWNSMISGFVKGGLSPEALELFRKMQLEKVKMDPMTVSSLLSACGKEGDLTKGKEIHGQAVKSRVFCSDIIVNNSLIDMYSKCGILDGSIKVFDYMEECNVVTWTTMISCYGFHGRGVDSLVLFDKMQAQGFSPNCVTLTAILASCSHSALAKEGQKIFHSMRSDYGIQPSGEHYACMVDLLGRLGRLEEALKLIEDMPQQPPSSVWGALLGACVVHKNVEIGEISAYQLFELEPRNGSNYIALSSIYEAVGRGAGVLGIRSRMRELGLFKSPGCSWIILEGGIHKFYHGPVSTKKMKHIYEILDRLSQLLMDSDYG